MSSEPPVPNTDFATNDLTGRWAAWLSEWPFTGALIGLCLAQLATWLPHFLTWPFFVDHDVYANLALQWDSGVLPYRQSACDNFPGTIYLFWAVGRVFGWGRTAPIFAVDAAFVVLYGVAMLAWSRARFGKILPGVVGYAAFLSYYLSLDFSQVVQHDWHAPLLVVLGLMLLEGSPRRSAVSASAVLTALAIGTRPQVVLFLPAVALAVRIGNGSTRRTKAESRRRLALGTVVFLVSLAVVFLPITAFGLWTDFLRSIQLVSYGSTYNRVTPLGALRQVLLQVMHIEYLIIPISVFALSRADVACSRASGLVWLAALGGAWFYKPLSPVPWPYLSHPLVLLTAMTTAVLAQQLTECFPGKSPLRLVALLLLVGASGVKIRPAYCSVQRSFSAIRSLRRGSFSVEPPLGYTGFEDAETQRLYPWENYRRLVLYLKRKPRPETRLANLLRIAPALVGPTGHPSALPAESLAWLVVNPRDVALFRKALEAADERTVVIWAPFEERQDDRYRLARELRQLTPTVRKHFEPEASFGLIEVWRSKRRP